MPSRQGPGRRRGRGFHGGRRGRRHPGPSRQVGVGSKPSKTSTYAGCRSRVDRRAHGALAPPAARCPIRKPAEHTTLAVQNPKPRGRHYCRREAERSGCAPAPRPCDGGLGPARGRRHYADAAVRSGAPTGQGTVESHEGWRRALDSFLRGNSDAHRIRGTDRRDSRYGPGGGSRADPGVAGTSRSLGCLASGGGPSFRMRTSCRPRTVGVESAEHWSEEGRR
jgi:hypothetical protein